MKIKTIQLIIFASLCIITFSCGNKDRKINDTVDSIFNNYHQSNAAFDESDVMQLMHYSDSVGSRYGAILAHLDLATIYTVRYNPSQAMKELSKVDVRASDPPFALAYADFAHGLAHQYNRDLGKALFYYRRAAETFEALKNIRALTVTYTNMSEIYADCGAWDLHDRYFQLSHALTPDNLMGGYGATTDSIYMFIHKGLYQKAYNSWKHYHPTFLRQIAAKELQPAYVYNHYDQAQTIYFKLGSYDSAAYYNNLLLKFVGEDEPSASRADIIIYKAKILAHCGDYQEALKFCQELLNQAKELPESTMLEVYPVLLDIYAALGNNNERLSTMQQYCTLLTHHSQQLLRNSLDQEIADQRYEELLKNSRAEQERLKSRMIITAFSALILVLILLTLTIYKQHKKDIEQKLRIKREQELDAVQHKLSQNQMEQALVQEQLVTYSQQMRELADDMPKPLRFRTFLNLEQINQHREDNAWKSFENAFEKEHNGFKQRLVHNYPQLSLTEVKSCMLMRTGMSSKEIANMLHITPESLRTTRYNIRKKLQLKESGTTLDEFIQQV